MSKRYTLAGTDLKKIGIGLVIAMIGAGLTYLETISIDIDFGNWTSIAVAINSVLVNVIRKFITKSA